jgi:hypothetical protein
MKHFAKFVNFFLSSIIVSDDPNCLILLTKFAGRRTIANLPATWQGPFDASQQPWHSDNFVTAHDGFTLKDLYCCNSKNNPQPPMAPSLLIAGIGLFRFSA